MNRRSVRRSKTVAALIAALAGGSLFGTCETRLKESVAEGLIGSNGYLYTTLLNPESDGFLLTAWFDEGGSDSDETQ